MNLILLFDDDFVAPDTVLLTGRRLRHVVEVHRAAPGRVLTLGVAGGKIGRGEVTRLENDALEMRVELDADPPPKIPLTLLLAVPRPKVLNRVLQTAASMGVPRIFLMNSWRVEKSFFRSPKLDAMSFREQLILGLEQARDTVFPEVQVRRFFRPFVEEEVPAIAAGTEALVAHPAAAAPCPRDVRGPVTLAIGPEGGFIADEVRLLEAHGFAPVSLGPRLLRVEAAVAAIIGRLFSAFL